MPGGGAGQRCAQFNPQLGKVTLDPAVTADQHMIVRGQALSWEQLAQQRAKSPLHPVADHCIADFFGDGDPKAHLVMRIGVNQQHKSRPRHAQAPVCG